MSFKNRYITEEETTNPNGTSQQIQNNTFAPVASENQAKPLTQAPQTERQQFDIRNDTLRSSAVELSEKGSTAKDAAAISNRSLTVGGQSEALAKRLTESTVINENNVVGKNVTKIRREKLAELGLGGEEDVEDFQKKQEKENKKKSKDDQLLDKLGLKNTGEGLKSSTTYAKNTPKRDARTNLGLTESAIFKVIKLLEEDDGLKRQMYHKDNNSGRGLQPVNHTLLAHAQNRNINATINDKMKSKNALKRQTMPKPNDDEPQWGEHHTRSNIVKTWKDREADVKEQREARLQQQQGKQ